MENLRWNYPHCLRSACFCRSNKNNWTIAEYLKTYFNLLYKWRECLQRIGSVEYITYIGKCPFFISILIYHIRNTTGHHRTDFINYSEERRTGNKRSGFIQIVSHVIIYFPFGTPSKQIGQKPVVSCCISFYPIYIIIHRNRLFILWLPKFSKYAHIQSRSDSK